MKNEDKEKLEKIRNVVKIYTNIDPVTKRRRQIEVFAKSLFCELAYKNTRVSLIKIGAFLMYEVNSQHSSVIHFQNNDWFKKDIKNPFISIRKEADALVKQLLV